MERLVLVGIVVECLVLVGVVLERLVLVNIKLLNLDVVVLARRRIWSRISKTWR